MRNISDRSSLMAALVSAPRTFRSDWVAMLDSMDSTRSARASSADWVAMPAMLDSMDSTRSARASSADWVAMPAMPDSMDSRRSCTCSRLPAIRAFRGARLTKSTMASACSSGQPACLSFLTSAWVSRAGCGMAILLECFPERPCGDPSVPSFSVFGWRLSNENRRRFAVQGLRAVQGSVSAETPTATASAHSFAAL